MNITSRKISIIFLTAVFMAAFFVPASYAESVTYYSSRSEAAAALREAMKSRETMVTVAFYENADSGGIKTIIGEVFDLALEHTGAPDEGDYLKYQYDDFTGRAATETHNGRAAVVLKYVINYYTDADQERQTGEMVKEILESLDLEGRSDYQKIRLIHDYICAHTEYDTENSGDSKGGTEHTAYGALVKGRAVCQGYSLALYRLLLEAGVDNRIIIGTGIEPGGIEGDHSWNIVKVNNEYFYIDTTWDDSLGSLEYFLRNRDFFESSHVMAGEYGEDFVTERHPVSQSGYACSFDVPAQKIVKAAKALAKAAASIQTG